MLNITVYEKNSILESLKEVLDYLPIIFVLGIITGFGPYTTIVGGFIISFVFFVFGKKYSFIFAPTIVYATVLASLNVSLGGRSETLFALLFVSSLITILISILKIHRKTVLTVPKPVIQGFMTGCFLSAFILSLPLIFGQKTFSTLGLMLSSKGHFFAQINEISLVFACLTFAIYYYLKKFKIKFISPAFMAVIIAGVINYFYNFNLENIYIGIKNFTPVATADFGHFIRLLISGLILSLIMTTETLLNLRASKKTNNEIKSPKMPVFLVGLANLFASVTGSIAGVLAKKSENGKNRFLTVVEAVVLLLFVIFFEKISTFIPIASISAILFITSYEAIKNAILAQRIKNVQSKIIFSICLICSLCNIILGFMIAIVFALVMKTKK